MAHIVDQLDRLYMEDGRILPPADATGNSHGGGSDEDRSVFAMRVRDAGARGWQIETARVGPG